MVPVLETPRLLLRPLGFEDVEAVQELFPHWEIVRFMSAHVPWPYPADGALRFIRDVALPSMQRGEQWIWAIRLKGGSEHLIGVINLSAKPGGNRGFWLGLPWQGQGLMTEACGPVNEFWFDGLGKERLVVSKAAGNLASRRVSEKEGARLAAIEERDYVSGRGPAEIWELSRDEWMTKRRLG